MTILVQRVPRHNVPLRFSLYRKMDIINITFRMASRHISPLTLPGIVEKSESNGGVNVDHVMRHVTPRQEGLPQWTKGNKMRTWTYISALFIHDLDVTSIGFTRFR